MEGLEGVIGWMEAYKRGDKKHREQKWEELEGASSDENLKSTRQRRRGEKTSGCKWKKRRELTS